MRPLLNDNVLLAVCEVLPYEEFQPSASGPGSAETSDKPLCLRTKSNVQDSGEDFGLFWTFCLKSVFNPVLSLGNLYPESLFSSVLVEF